MQMRLMRDNPVPFALALQGLALSVVAFLVSPDLAKDTDFAARPSGGDLTQSAQQIAVPMELPRDLEPERLQFPRLPERDDPGKPPQPASEIDAPPGPIVQGPKLASLRVHSVALASIMAINLSTPRLDGPDSTEGMSITGAGRSWLTGRSKSRVRQGRSSSGGPIGVGPVGGLGRGGGGGGGGGNCPAPGGRR